MTKTAEIVKHAIIKFTSAYVRCICGWERVITIDDLIDHPKDLLLDAYNDHTGGSS